MNEEKKQEKKQEEPKAQQAKPRQIVIEFNAQQINIIKAEVSSNWEFESILRKLLKNLNI